MTKHHEHKSQPSALANALTPKLSLLITYPHLLTSMRVSVYKELSRDPLHPARRMHSIVASFNHGRDLYSKFGLFSLYRGAEVYLLHSLLKTQIHNATRKSLRRPRLATIARYCGDAAIYPLYVACARIITHTKGDSGDWSIVEAYNETIKYDGIPGLWAGLAPYLLISVCDDAIGSLMDVFKSRFPDHDTADEAIAYASLIALSAVVTAPLATIANVMRCQSESPQLPNPQSLKEIVSSIEWRDYGVMFGLISGFCALNCKLIPCAFFIFRFVD